MVSEKVSKILIIYVVGPLALLTLLLCYVEAGSGQYDDYYNTLESQEPHAKYSEEMLAMLDRTEPAVVLIKTHDKQGRCTGSGTGFFIDSCQLITNHHVIRNAHRASAYDSSGNKYEITGVVAKDINADIVRLTVNTDNQHPPKLEFAHLTPDAGDNVYVVGHPLGGPTKITKGIMNSTNINPDKCITFQVSAYVDPGSSGSPLLNNQGKVLGVVKAKKNTSHVTTMATPKIRIEQLVAENEAITLPKYSAIHSKPPQQKHFTERFKFRIRTSNQN